MSKIINDRMFARMDGDFVVFMIGMRINSFWKIHKWFPVILSMPKMIKELYANKDYGFLNMNNWFGRTTIMVQYWRSFEDLDAYAKNKDLVHLPAWRIFNLKIRNSGAVGIWHETYKVSAGNYENIYVNMPKFGLSKAANLLSVTEIKNDATQRMENKNNL